MILTKTSLPRRTFLRGVGATVALPLLDAMVPALTAQAKTAAAPVHRFGAFYVPNGMHMSSFIPATEGPGFALSPTLRPLEPFRDRIVVVSRLANIQAEAMEVGGGPHPRAHAVWLNGVRPKRTEGADIRAGITLDQLAARELAKDTQLTSLEMTLEPSYLVGNCTGGYSCVYVNSTSWRTPTTPLPMENNPRAVFERLFGDGATGAARARQLRRNRSILDSVTGTMRRLQGSLGPGDQSTVGEYLDAIREVERRIQKAERHTDAVPTAMPQPAGIPATFEEHARLMFDLQVLAYQADVTRVATLQIGREQSMRTYPQIGIEGGHHDISHMGSLEQVAQNAKINTYHVEMFRYLLERLQATPDGDGSLLDHVILFYGSGFGDGSLHSPHNLPLLLAGGGCGTLEGGRHIKAAMDTPLMNAGVGVLHKMGIGIESVGDSTGPLVDL